MGEPNVKLLIMMPGDPDKILTILEELGYVVRSAQKLSIEIYPHFDRGSIYIVPKGPIFDPSILKDETQDMGPDLRNGEWDSKVKETEEEIKRNKL